MKERPKGPPADILCPDCSGASLRNIGKLPRASSFAGRPMPRGEDASLYCCLRCGLRFRHPRLRFDEYAALYDNSEVEVWHHAKLRPDQLLVKTYLESDASTNSVLDFGCFTGQFLQTLNPRISRFGIEINRAAAAVAARNAQARVESDLLDFEPDMKFDAIVAMDVVEHFESPRLLFKKLLGRLSPNGKLIVTTGDGEALLWRLAGSRWWYSYFPEHIAFISKRWIDYHTHDLELRLLCCKSFNYTGASPIARIRGILNFLVYLSFPKLHLKLRQLKNGESADIKGVPGAGASNDHLFISVCRDEEPCMNNSKQVP